MGWAVYDFGSTVYSAIVITAYFPLYLTEMAGANWVLGVATTGAMLFAAAVVPVLGSISDETGHTKRYLVRITLGSIFFLALLALNPNPFLLIVTFAISCFFFHTCVVFYNSLLPVVAPADKQGLISGVGVGVGYLGVVLVMPLAHLVDQSFGRPAVFLLTACIFLLFSLPLFILVPERKVAEPVPFKRGLWVREWKKVLNTIKTLPQKKVLFFFLLGNFFVVDALNCVIAWTLVTGRELFHPSQEALVMLLMGVNAAAFLAGILNGLLTDRFGAMQTMILSSGVLMVSIVLIALAPTFEVFVSVCLIGGAFAVSGIWTAGRKVIIELVRKEELGVYFGLYGLTTKVSVIAGLVFSIVADLLGFRSALWVLVAPALGGWLLLIISAQLRKKERYEANPTVS